MSHKKVAIRNRKTIPQTKSRKKDTLQADIVVNLSTYQLTKYEISVLSKGRKFMSTPMSINKTKLSADIKKFNRRMRLKQFFQKNENDSDDNTIGTEHLNSLLKKTKFQKIRQKRS